MNARLQDPGSSLKALNNLALGLNPAASGRASTEFERLGVALTESDSAESFTLQDVYGRLEPTENASNIYVIEDAHRRRTAIFLNVAFRSVIDATVRQLGYALCRVTALGALSNDSGVATQTLATAIDVRVRPYVPKLPYRIDDTLVSVALDLGSTIPDEQLREALQHE